MLSRPTPRPRRAKLSCARSVRAGLAAAALAALAPAAPAQFYGGGYGGGYGGDSCGCSTASAAPAYTTSYSTASAGYYGGSSYSTVSGCTPVYETAYAAPVYQTAAVECTPVQTVAVCEPPRMVAVPRKVTARVPETKYVSVTETVKQPRTVTRYEEREFTEMVPQTETRTAMTQQVNYRPVSNTRQVIQDKGYWQTRRIANRRVSPCEYDPRPGFRGSMRRFGYNLRSAFTPRYTTQRQYVPQKMACNVTTTSQVAEVTNVPRSYQVTTMVPTIKKRQVAVQEVVWEDRQVTAMKPVTEYKEVSRTVYNYLPSTDPVAVAYLSGRGTTTTALAPTPEDRFRSAGADDGPTRAADASDGTYKRDDAEFDDDTATGRVDPRDRRTRRPAATEPAPKVRQLTAADRARLAKLRVAARERDAGADRLADRRPAAPARRAARPAAPVENATVAAAAPSAANRVPRVTAARRWDAFDGPALPTLALADRGE